MFKLARDGSTWPASHVNRICKFSPLLSSGDSFCTMGPIYDSVQLVHRSPICLWLMAGANWTLSFPGPTLQEQLVKIKASPRSMPQCAAPGRLPRGRASFSLISSIFQSMHHSLWVFKTSNTAWWYSLFPWPFSMANFQSSRGSYPYLSMIIHISRRFYWIYLF